MESGEPGQPPEPAADGEPPATAASRALIGRALGLVILAGVAVFAVIIFLPGLDRGTRLAASFIFAPVVVTPIIAAQAKVTPETLLVGAVLGGEIAAVLYATGQEGRFSGWLFAVELVALLLASRTLHMLRAARVPGVPLDPARSPAPAGIALIALLTPLALAAGILDAMARFPVGAAVGALVPGVVVALRGAAPETVIITLITAVPLALVPAAIRRARLRGRRSPS